MKMNFIDEEPRANATASRWVAMIAVTLVGVVGLVFLLMIAGSQQEERLRSSNAQLTKCKSLGGEFDAVSENCYINGKIKDV